MVRTFASIVALLAWGTWLGGLVALGAISAPLVFRNVPAPYSADAMTLVFRRFDVVAMICAALVVGRELLSLLDGISQRLERRRVEMLRMASAVAAAVLAVVEGLWLSPSIEALHRAGAVRHVGELGERLETMHGWAESVSKAELLFLVAFVICYIVVDSYRLPKA